MGLTGLQVVGGQLLHVVGARQRTLQRGHTHRHRPLYLLLVHPSVLDDQKAQRVGVRIAQAAVRLSERELGPSTRRERGSG